MDRRGFLGMLFILGAGGWIGLKGLFGLNAERGPREARYYRKIQ